MIQLEIRSFISLLLPYCTICQNDKFLTDRSKILPSIRISIHYIKITMAMRVSANDHCCLPLQFERSLSMSTDS